MSHDGGKSRLAHAGDREQEALTISVGVVDRRGAALSEGADETVEKGSGLWDRRPAPGERVRLTEWLEQQAADSVMRQVALRSLALLDLRPGMRVLEVGCGTGVFLPLLAGAVAPDGRVTGIDHSAAFLEEARQRVVTTGFASPVTLQEADAYHLPFADASFDAAHVEHVLEHLEDPDVVLREMRRVVRPDGWIVAGEPYLLGNEFDHPDPEGLHLVLAHGFRRFRSPRIGLELNRRMAQAGLVDRKVEVFTRVAMELDPENAKVFADIAAEAVTEGLLTRDRADALVQQFHVASQGGYFTSYSPFFLVAGRVAP